MGSTDRALADVGVADATLGRRFTE